MGSVFFYHLTETSLESTLPMILNKSLSAGWRVLVRSQSTGLLDRLDTVLWTTAKDEFIPHARVGGEFDADQPILLAETAPVSGFDCLISLAGDMATHDEIAALERTSIIFDGNDETELSDARNQWKSLTESGCQAQYWAQDAGRWVKKAEAN